MSFRKLVRNLMTRSFRTPKSYPARRRFAPLGRPFEALEDRTVPAVSVSFAAGVLTFTGDGIGDTVLVQSTATAGNVQYNAGGLGLTTQSGVNSIVYNANGGDDILVIANPSANILTPAAPGVFNITFNGGGQAGDELDFVGGASTWTSSYAATSASGKRRASRPVFFLCWSTRPTFRTCAPRMNLSTANR